MFFFINFTMKHIKSSFYFTKDDEVYWDFDRIPNTKTENPTKTQTKEIIASAKKLYKEKYKIRDERDKKISKILE